MAILGRYTEGNAYIRREADGAFVPAGSPAFADLLAMVEDGEGEIAPYVPPAPSLPPLALQQVAAVRLLLDGWDVTGIERSQGLSVAFVADTDTVWAFFNDPQPDPYYVVTPSDGVTKFEDHIEITRPGLAEVSLVVSRVQ